MSVLQCALTVGNITPGVICNCSSVVVNVKYNPCPTGPPGNHVYGLDLSWRSQYVALGFSRLGGWLSPMVGNLTQLKMLSLANNRYVAHCNVCDFGRG